MATKIKIKFGNVEVEYEGPESFLNKKLTDLVANLATVDGLRFDMTDEHDSEGDKKISKRKSGAGKIAATTNTIAAKLECSSGPDLIIASSARLMIVLGKSSFKRKELFEEMKGASTYYKKSYAKNLTQYLNSLVRSGKLNESAKNTYSLTAGTKSDIEKKLS